MSRVLVVAQWTGEPDMVTMRGQPVRGAGARCKCAEQVRE
jgi:hypothetical protein